MTAAIDLYWLPLGAGGHVVRWNGRVYEALCARLQHRPAGALYHSALQVRLPPDNWVIEMTPVWADKSGVDRGVVAQGAVGAPWAGRSRFFRYEVRRWRGGAIGDVAEAVATIRVSSDEEICRLLLAALPAVPTPVWGRDELVAGEMWNSNSVTSWALARAGVDSGGIHPPAGGRAPGWRAGVVVARRPQPDQPYAGQGRVARA